MQATVPPTEWPMQATVPNKCPNLWPPLPRQCPWIFAIRGPTQSSRSNVQNWLLHQTYLSVCHFIIWQGIKCQFRAPGRIISRNWNGCRINVHSVVVLRNGVWSTNNTILVLLTMFTALLSLAKLKQMEVCFSKWPPLKDWITRRYIPQEMCDNFQ